MNEKKWYPHWQFRVQQAAHVGASVKQRDLKRKRQAQHDIKQRRACNFVQCPDDEPVIHILRGLQGGIQIDKNSKLPNDTALR